MFKLVVTMPPGIPLDGSPRPKATFGVGTLTFPANLKIFYTRGIAGQVLMAST
jgi:hypothetical protein